MYYGIDLGTTNSLIGLASTGYLSDLVPSCVDMKTGDCGAHLYDDMTAKRSFKVDISMGSQGAPSIAASTCVLKKLKEIAGGDCVKDVVISVPAYFTDNQREATILAAENARLNVKSIINEPTAAAIYIAQKRMGLFVVYDLGGGTFDVSVIDSRFGTYDVQATGGTKCGGDNFDKDIMRFFMKQGNIKAFRLSDVERLSLQHFSCKQKIKMQKLRKPFKIDLSQWGGTEVVFTPDAYRNIMYMTFGQTVECLKRITGTYIQDGERYEVLLVGGSTRCPFLREWISDVTGQKVADLTYDPDRAVALGAALYAQMLENGDVTAMVSDVTRQLSIGLADGTCKVLIPANSKIPMRVEHIFVNPVKSASLELTLYQGEHTFSRDNELIGTLLWEYNEPKEAMEGQVIVTVEVDVKGIITFSAHELLRQPKTIRLDRRLC